MHTITENRVMLGQRFITCSCGEGFSGGAYDNIAERNHAHHVKTERQAAEERMAKALSRDGNNPRTGFAWNH